MSESVLPPVPRNERFDVLAPRVPLADLGSVHVLAAGGARSVDRHHDRGRRRGRAGCGGIGGGAATSG